MAHEEEGGEFLYHTHCDNCGSSDANAVYDNNSTYCFSCGHSTREAGATIRPRSKSVESKTDDLIPIGSPTGWPSRGITEKTAKTWGFTRSEFKGSTVRVFNYKDPQSKELIAQKVRPRSKEDMRTVGPKRKKLPLYGQWLWRDGGRKVVITEGEMDAMSVSQMQDHKWPVVSIPNGAQAAAKSLSRAMDWLDRFDEVILMFDEDEEGRKAVAQCAPLFAPGKCKIAQLPLKDANEMLKAGRGSEIIDAIWGAKEFRPDGLVSIDDILDEIKEPVEWGLPWCFDTLTQATYGRRYGEVYTIGAGTGIGKTDFMTQQMLFDIHELGLHVGAIYLEQKPKETGKRIAGKLAGRRFHVPKEKAGWLEAELDAAVEALRGKVTFYDSWGQTDWEVVKGHMRFMAVSMGIKVFYLDHLTAMADTANEKESIEQLMKELAGLANELGLIIHLVSHLATPMGTPHEEGGRVMVRHFKGSRSIGFWSYFMFGMERNPQDEDREAAKTTTFRILKDRYTGDSTGSVFYLGYDTETGRLFEKPDYDPTSTQEKTHTHSFEPHTAEDEDVPF